LCNGGCGLGGHVVVFVIFVVLMGLMMVVVGLVLLVQCVLFVFKASLDNTK
jgi:hypothetical protein